MGPTLVERDCDHAEPASCSDHLPPALMSGRKCVSMSLVAKKLVFRVSSACTGNGVVSATGNTERIEPGRCYALPEM